MNLLCGLAEAGVDLYLYSDAPLAECHLRRLPQGTYRVRISPGERYFVWEQVWLPKQSAADGIEILHCPIHFGLPWKSACPRVLTLHDAIDQIYYKPKMKLRERVRKGHLVSQLHAWIARTKAEKVIAVSQHAGSDLVKHLGIPAERIQVIYEAADEVFTRTPVVEPSKSWLADWDLSKPYAFYIGGYEGRKNIPFLLKEFAGSGLSNVELVLAGNAAAFDADLKRLAIELHIEHQVRWLGVVEDADLVSLYDNALCFVYPSLYEGFGLQICEAMARGCPVLASNRTSLPEILGSGGALFDPGHPGELAALLTQCATIPEFRRELAIRARLRSQAFTWKETARQTIKVYEAAIGASARRRQSSLSARA